MHQDEHFFTINGALAINVIPVNEVPKPQDFELEIPAIFRMAGELYQEQELIEQLSTSQQSLEMQQILKILKTQSDKINRLLSFQLSQQNEKEYAYKTESFGASALTFLSDLGLEIGQYVHLKLFLENPAAAIYSYGKVTRCEQQNASYLIHLNFARLTNVDEDLLVRATLQEQRRQLKMRRESLKQNLLQ